MRELWKRLKRGKSMKISTRCQRRQRCHTEQVIWSRQVPHQAGAMVMRILWSDCRVIQAPLKNLWPRLRINTYKWLRAHTTIILPILAIKTIKLIVRLMVKVLYKLSIQLVLWFLYNLQKLTTMKWNSFINRLPLFNKNTFKIQIITSR